MSRTQKPFGDMVTPASYEAGGEFIDREPVWPPSKFPQDFTAPGELQNNLENTPLGEPPIDVDVRSTYDVRPIQAFDVNLNLESATELAQGGEGTNLTTLVFNPVPLGYVFVLRSLSPFFFGVLPPVIFRNDATITLLRNRAEVPYNIRVPVGLDATDLTTFIIYDEGEEFGARLNLAATIASFSGAFFGCVFYGNFLRKTGRPAPQEIGNPVARPRRSDYR